ncbi:hypothetical protein KCP71_12330 [Salmonella enterica subsp. enterica]|nr:hypothetical protein KCP71_12330 [Salmonella enterica subsp. enterica]
MGPAPSAQYIISPFSRMAAPASFEPCFIPRPILASMICLIYRAMGARNCWICVDLWPLDNHLYQVKDARWQRVHGWFGWLSYPALTRVITIPP